MSNIVRRAGGAGGGSVSMDSPTFTGTVRSPRFVTDPITLTAGGGVITPNAATGSLFRHTATANVQLADPTGGVNGQAVVVEVLASGADRTVTFAGGATAVTVPAGQKWTGELRLDSTLGEWLLVDGSGGSSSSGGVGGAGGAVSSVNGQTGVVVLTSDSFTDGTANHVFTTADDTKLTGIASGATANATDAQLRARSTHTGTQTASTVSDFAAVAKDEAAAMITGAAHTGVSFAYNSVSKTLAASVTGGGADAATPYGRVFLDDFAGADDDAKLTAAMTAMAAETYPRTITLRARQYTFTTANRIAYTGLRIEGPPGYGNPERQSQTKMPGRVHLSMTGPWFHNNAATVFSCSFHQLSFTGGSQATVIGQSGGGSWYCLSMRDIFSSGTRTVLGTQATPLLITAASFTGDWEINNCYNGAFHIGGSDNVLWQDGCLLDSDPAFNTAGSANGQYHLWFDSLEKSEVGPLYITAEGPWNGIRVTGPAWNTVTSNTGTSWWHGVRVEGRNKDQPCNGTLLRVEGGFVSIRDSWFGYAMASPATPGHSPADAGVVHHSGGGLSVHTCTYDRATGVAETVPFVYANSSGPTRVNNIWTAARGGTWTGLPRVSDVGSGTLTTDTSVTVI